MDDTTVVGESSDLLLNVSHYTDVTESLMQLPRDLPPSRTLSHSIIYATLLSIIIAISIAGNLLVILAIATTTHLRQQLSNVYLINLAITDLGCASIVMSSSLALTLLDRHQLYTYWCDSICAANYLFIIVSMLSLAFISVDRHVYITRPLTYHTIVTKGRVLTRCLYTWLQGALIASIPPCLGWVHYDYWEAICAVNWQNTPGKVIYVSLAFIFCFLVPGCVILSCYASIISTARRSTQNSRIIHPNNQDTTARCQNNYLKHHRKTVTSFALVVCIFFICMTPFCITKLIKVTVPYVETLPAWVEAATCLCQYLACSLNPFIYAILRKDFQLAFLKVTRKFVCQH